MTPLYHRLVKRLTLPERSRERLDDPHGLLADLSDVQCFECSAVRSMMDYLTAAGREVHTGERPLVQADHSHFFQPVPRSWLEWVSTDGRRLAIFAKSLNDVYAVVETKASIAAMRLVENGVAVCSDLARVYKSNPNVRVQSFLGWCLAALAIINSPSVVGRRERPAHKGLALKIATRDGPAFEVHPWYEIRLEVFKPRDIDDGEPHKDRIVGHRALHFGRAFLRIRLGKVEHVGVRWRGDPALGIQASYRVKP